MPADTIRDARFSRRQLLRAVPLGAAAWWMQGARVLTQSVAFRFIVVNDLHHATPECDPFFRALVAQMSSHGVIDFCLIVGDLADAGRPESFAAVRDAFAALRVPIYTVPGNHDNDVEKTTRIYSEFFPGRLNYTFRHKEWQFIGLDSTEAEKYQNTRIGDTTLGWLDATLPALDRARPTVLFTHFPLASGVNLVPVNAADLLSRVSALNLRGAFTGHYHARIEKRDGNTPLLTNACCSRMRDNHDGSLDEGYLLCSATNDGRLSWEFVEFKPARRATV
ncbi:MAG TPA: metallophosphoesterase [Vicinamibacterales bacterium]|nr:metallophosphoesterase [Vicinamibacterales bacterium]